MKQIYFQGQLCQVSVDRYANGNIALYLVGFDNNEFIASCTVDVPGYELLADECLITTHADNVGILEALVEARAVTALGIRVPYTRLGTIAQLCQLSPAILKTKKLELLSKR